MLHYRRAGAGEVVVLLHGFMGGSGYWHAEIEALQPHFDVIAIDLPGFAGSARRAPVSTMENFAQAVVDTLDALRVERFHLLGHSMGGMVAQQIAIDHLDRLRTLVLYGTSCRGSLPGRFETIAQTAARLRAEGVEAAAARIAATWFIEGAVAAGYSMCREAASGTSLVAATQALEAIERWEVERRLGRVNVPTLVICGDRDRSCPPVEAHRLLSALPRADLCIVPNSAHAAHLEMPELFCAAVFAHLLRGRAGTPDACR